MPPTQWFRGPLRERVYDTLLIPSFLGRGMVSPDFARYMLAEHDRGRRNNQSYIYQLLMLELWFKALEEPASSPTLSLVC
ncbi:MAG TPA: asparagine synthase-related protein [Terriglobales bacterium]